MPKCQLTTDGDFPDVGNGEVPCCLGAAVYGPAKCTCWTPVYDQGQQEAAQGPLAVRGRMCRDCAFRPDSPERRGDTRYDHADEEGLERVVAGTFVCHQGLRRLVRWEHPSGAVAEVGIDAYSPPGIDHPVKADGRPADLCAGWAAAQEDTEPQTG